MRTGLLQVLFISVFLSACAASQDGAVEDRAGDAGNAGSHQDAAYAPDDLPPLDYDIVMSGGDLLDSWSPPEDEVEGEPWDGTCPALRRGDLIFTEFILSPAADRHSESQWLELYNRLDEPLCLNLCHLRVLGPGGFEVRIRAPHPLVVPGRGYFLVGGTGVRELVHAVWPEGKSLPSGGATVQLLSPEKRVIDTLQFGGSKFAIPLPPKGESLYLCSHCLDGHCSKAPMNWKHDFLCMPPHCIDIESYDTLGNKGTPGQANPDCL